MQSWTTPTMSARSCRNTRSNSLASLSLNSSAHSTSTLSMTFRFCVMRCDADHAAGFEWWRVRSLVIRLTFLCGKEKVLSLGKRGRGVWTKEQRGVHERKMACLMMKRKNSLHQVLQRVKRYQRKLQKEKVEVCQVPTSTKQRIHWQWRQQGTWWLGVVPSSLSVIAVFFKINIAFWNIIMTWLWPIILHLPAVKKSKGTG